MHEKIKEIIRFYQLVQHQHEQFLNDFADAGKNSSPRLHKNASDRQGKAMAQLSHGSVQH